MDATHATEPPLLASTLFGRSHRAPGGLLARCATPLALIWATAAFATGSDPDVRTRLPPPLIGHTVVSGDTLYSLARKYGSSVELLIEENGITDVRKVRTGTLLRVPYSKTSIRRNIEHFVESSEIQLRSAHFESALESAEAARALLDALPDASHRKSRVRLEIVRATVQVAFGDHDAALSSLGRALKTDPDLELDPAVVSPKVMRVFHAAREPIPSTP